MTSLSYQVPPRTGGTGLTPESSTPDPPKDGGGTGGRTGARRALPLVPLVRTTKVYVKDERNGIDTQGSRTRTEIPCGTKIVQKFIFAYFTVFVSSDRESPHKTSESVLTLNPAPTTLPGSP